MAQDRRALIRQINYLSKETDASVELAGVVSS